MMRLGSTALRRLSTHQSSAPSPLVAQSGGWFGKDKAKNPDQWTYRLSDSDLTQLDIIVKRLARGSAEEFAKITKPDVPLPKDGLGGALERIQHEVLEGDGFILVKGLPVHKYTVKEAAAAYWAIGCHLGLPTPQNGKGHLLGHVKDLGHNLNLPTTRIYATSAAQPFHIDLCDIVGLLCLKTAERGGESIIASSITVYNELLRLRPDLAELLAQPVYHDRKGEIPAGKDPYYAMPVFNFHGKEKQLSVFLSPDFVRTTERFEELPKHTPALKEAMKLMQELPQREDIRLDMVLEPGDMQFIHNHTILHSRTQYQDFTDPALKRHLLRLWLSPEKARALPEIFCEQYGNVVPGKRGGIRVPGVVPNIKFEAE